MLNRHPCFTSISRKSRDGECMVSFSSSISTILVCVFLGRPHHPTTFFYKSLLANIVESGVDYDSTESHVTLT